MQEKDEKVNVEDSFLVKSLPHNEREAIDSDPGTSGTAVAVPWNVKLEQSFNIFLSVSCLFLFLEIFIVSLIYYYYMIIFCKNFL